CRRHMMFPRLARWRPMRTTPAFKQEIRASPAARVVWQAVDEQSRWRDFWLGCGAFIADFSWDEVVGLPWWLASPDSGSIALDPEAAVESALGGRPIHGLRRA